jgi:hypothetical protein
LALLKNIFTVATLVVLLASLTSCGGGSLTTAATDLIDAQRRSNLTRDKLTGLWDGEVVSTDGVGRQSIVLDFAQGEGFDLDGSILIGSDIRIGSAVVRDTFAMVNGVYKEGDIRFNLAPPAGSPVIISEGEPVLFIGLLSENGFMSGEMKAGGRLLGLWEAIFSNGTETPAEPPVEAL